MNNANNIVAPAVVPSNVDAPVVGARTVRDLVWNANRLGKGAQSVALAASFLGLEAKAVCCGCYHGMGTGKPTREFTHEAVRLNAGDLCGECSYLGPDTLVVWPK